jgi:hypothetical protein
MLCVAGPGRYGTGAKRVHGTFESQKKVNSNSGVLLNDSLENHAIFVLPSANINI